MTGGDARRAPWRWPNLDQVTGPGGEFVPMTPAGDAASRPAGEGAGEAVLEGAREAERLVDAARIQADQIRRQTGEEAAREARERLEALLHETIDEQVAIFEQARDELLGQVRAASRERMDELEREVARLVAQMAEKVVRRKIEADDAIVLDVVRAALEKAAGASRITVRVSGADEPAVGRAQAELLAAAAGAEDLEIVADEAVEPGGCIVETERGRFDARIDTQIEMLGDEIGRVLGGD